MEIVFNLTVSLFFLANTRTGFATQSRWVIHRLCVLYCPGRDTITGMVNSISFISKYSSILLAAVLLTACSSAAPTADPDGPRLTGFDSLPKAMATVGPLPSPNAPQVQATLDSH